MLVYSTVDSRLSYTSLSSSFYMCVRTAPTNPGLLSSVKAAFYSGCWSRDILTRDMKQHLSEYSKTINSIFSQRIYGKMHVYMYICYVRHEISVILSISCLSFQGKGELFTYFLVGDDHVEPSHASPGQSSSLAATPCPTDDDSWTLRLSWQHRERVCRKLH